MERSEMASSLEQYFDRLWPICRSITGDGLRNSLRILTEVMPMEIHEVETGTKVFDWEIPNEWNIEEAYIITPNGRRICDFKVNNLHVLNYSVPVRAKLSFDQLRKHLYSLPSMPEAIPYMTSYYKEDWGFCIAQKELDQLATDGEYEVCIKSTLKPGSLTFGEAVLKGSSDKEVLFSSYLCHPSMANNELSGPLAMAFLYQRIAAIQNRKYTYRFVLAPETIGVITFLSLRGQHLLQKLEAGYVLTCCGDTGKYTYQRSKKGATLADRAAEHVLKYCCPDSTVRDFSIGGSDERQYCSAGFNLPVGSVMRTPYKEFREYHTSLDNKNFISFEALAETVETYLKIVRTLELNDFYKTTVPFCEPQLGKRGLYPVKGGQFKAPAAFVFNLLHFLSYADGESDLISIAEKRNKSVLEFEDVINMCRQKALL